MAKTAKNMFSVVEYFRGVSSSATARRYSLFLALSTVIFSSGCAHSPFFTRWDFSTTPDLSEHYSSHQAWQESIAGKYEPAKKSTKNKALYYDSVVDVYDSNGVLIGQAGVR